MGQGVAFGYDLGSDATSTQGISCCSRMRVAWSRSRLLHPVTSELSETVDLRKGMLNGRSTMARQTRHPDLYLQVKRPSPVRMTGRTWSRIG
jgi:hypothetical protein